MITYHSRNIAAFRGAHISYWTFQPFMTTVISSTTETVLAAAVGSITAITQRFTRPAERV